MKGNAPGHDIVDGRAKRKQAALRSVNLSILSCEMSTVSFQAFARSPRRTVPSDPENGLFFLCRLLAIPECLVCSGLSDLSLLGISVAVENDVPPCRFHSDRFINRAYDAGCAILDDIIAK